MIRAARPWRHGRLPRPGLCLILAVTAALSAGDALAQDKLLPVLPPVAAPAPAAAPGAGAPGEGAPGSEAAETSSSGASRLLERMEQGAAAAQQPALGLGSIPACPRDILTRLLADAAGRDDALSVLAVEREMLKLCAERERVVAEIFEMDAKLEALRAAAEEAAEEAERALSPAGPRAAPAVLSRLEDAAAGDRSAAASASGQSTRAEEKKGPAPPSYSWFSVFGRPGDLRVGVTDGEGWWFLREGDALPGGLRIERIATRPIRVWIEGAEEALLPNGPPPEGGP